MRRPTTAAFYARPISQAKSATPAATSPPGSLRRSSSSAGEIKPVTPSPILPNTKENRAWEHDRQRVRKAADFVKAKARKGQAGSMTQTKFCGPRKFDDKVVHDESEVEVLDAVDDVSPPVADRSRVSRPTPTDDGIMPLSARRSEVQLADLVTSKKPRHGREVDFEVIPHIRSVIVLDDNIPPDLDFDEPWEHIYGVDDDQTTHEPSYAKIAALN
ncbi:hypothetical protein Hypma_013456 [Hypsizygus marmoreus]|uniref:Uncharacterized protein n=1 Tax=Hypsizygus marmoreus TaxID=39966 RepID=A0A369JIE6_HYPMA|nr:hypothetical protein Hypma_013456 [Hypsizygus marmoreus]